MPPFPNVFKATNSYVLNYPIVKVKGKVVPVLSLNTAP
jgi:hypothetical protein